MPARTRHGLPVLQTGPVMRDADAPSELAAAAADASTAQERRCNRRHAERNRRVKIWNDRPCSNRERAGSANPKNERSARRSEVRPVVGLEASKPAPQVSSSPSSSVWARKRFIFRGRSEVFYD